MTGKRLEFKVWSVHSLSVISKSTDWKFIRVIELIAQSSRTPSVI